LLSAAAVVVALTMEKEVAVVANFFKLEERLLLRLILLL
jgi:hypothetical protein